VLANQFDICTHSGANHYMPIFPEEMQATKQQALWAKDKESESRSAGV